MTLPQKSKAVIAFVGVVGAFALGRYTGPTKVKIQTIEVEKKVETLTLKKEQKRKKKIVKTETVKPTGEKTTTTVITDVTTDKESAKNKLQALAIKKEQKEVTSGGSRIRISALGAYDFSSKSLVWGGAVSKQLLGPINFGFFYLTNNTAGVNLGLDL
jgi:hypothetical protein